MRFATRPSLIGRDSQNEHSEVKLWVEALERPLASASAAGSAVTIEAAANCGSERATRGFESEARRRCLKLMRLPVETLMFEQRHVPKMLMIKMLMLRS
jgi:hypothetical protein